jgi:threonine dehydratase
LTENVTKKLRIDSVKASSVTALPLGLNVFEAAYAHVAPHTHRTPLLTSRTLSDLTGFEVRLKAEIFQRTGSYKIRGPLNKFMTMTAEERARGVVCSSAGNHAQGVALAARIHGIKAVVVMAANATPSKIAATRGYGAEVVLHGTIWDEANDKARELVRERGLTYVHPFDDLQLIAGQGTLGLEIVRDWPEVDLIVVPIGGGGLISGVAMAAKALKPSVKVVGVESSGAPGMLESIRTGSVVTLDRVDCIIDGLRVKRVGETTFEVVKRVVDGIVTLPDEQIFEAMLWTMSRAKLVVEGAAAAPVGALLQGLIDAPAGAKVVCVLSGGNVNLDQIRGLRWN